MLAVFPVPNEARRRRNAIVRSVMASRRVCRGYLIQLEKPINIVAGNGRVSMKGRPCSKSGRYEKTWSEPSQLQCVECGPSQDCGIGRQAGKSAVAQIF